VDLVGTGGRVLAIRCETPLFAPFVYQMHHFTKTGSGQTQGKLKKRVAFRIGLPWEAATHETRAVPFCLLGLPQLCFEREQDDLALHTSCRLLAERLSASQQPDLFCGSNGVVAGAMLSQLSQGLLADVDTEWTVSKVEKFREEPFNEERR
jgi:hypothetical protein